MARDPWNIQRDELAGQVLTPAPVLCCRSVGSLAVVLALVAASAGVADAQRFRDFTTTIPEEYANACELDRSDLVVRVIAQNEEVYPQRAARTPGGWLVYDRYEEQVVELDQDLRRVGSWGRQGPGPMEYEDPVGMGRLDADRVVIVDASPPSLIVFGPGANDRNEHRLVMDARPQHAVIVDGRLLIATSDATVHEASLDGELRLVHTRTDFGLPQGGGSGASAVPRLRGNHIGFTGPSQIWTLGAQPQQIVQRCIHDDLKQMLEAPVQIDTPFGPLPFNLTTMKDFLPLGADGFLALGGLVVRVDGRLRRSIEHYDATGNLTQAWLLTGYLAVNGVFDDQVTGRMLLWQPDAIAGVQLVEVEGLGR